MAGGGRVVMKVWKKIFRERYKNITTNTLIYVPNSFPLSNDLLNVWATKQSTDRIKYVNRDTLLVTLEDGSSWYVIKVVQQTDKLPFKLNKIYARRII